MWYNVKNEADLRELTMKGTTKGLLLAMAAASFLTSGVGHANTASNAELIKCQGGNACKGQSGCQTANSTCSGFNGCRGQGWVMMSRGECKRAGGVVIGD